MISRSKLKAVVEASYLRFLYYYIPPDYYLVFNNATSFRLSPVDAAAGVASQMK